MSVGEEEEAAMVEGRKGEGKAEVGPETSLGEGEHYRPAPAGFRQEWRNEGVVERLANALNGRV